MLYCERCITPKISGSVHEICCTHYNIIYKTYFRLTAQIFSLHFNVTIHFQTSEPFSSETVICELLSSDTVDSLFLTSSFETVTSVSEQTSFCWLGTSSLRLVISSLSSSELSEEQSVSAGLVSESFLVVLSFSGTIRDTDCKRTISMLLLWARSAHQTNY